MNELFERIQKTGIVPVIKIDDAKDILPLSEALLKGGIDIAEITFRTDAAAEAITLVKREFPKMLVGAGTVLSTENADKAQAAGAEFIVTPGFNPKIVDYCISKNIPIIPGCSIPSEIEFALERGLEVVKFFPAEESGGLAKIKAMSAPYSGVRFMPTGGISLENLGKYAAFPKIIACGGSFMVKDTLIKNGKWDEITELSKKAVDCIREARAKSI